MHTLDIIDSVPGVERDPAFIPSTRHRASSVAGLDAIRYGVRI